MSSEGLRERLALALRERPGDRELLLLILEGEHEIMADFTALNAAITKLQSDVDALTAGTSAAVAAAEAANQSSVDAATAAVQAVDATVVAATPAPAPSPAP